MPVFLNFFYAFVLAKVAKKSTAIAPIDTRNFKKHKTEVKVFDDSGIHHCLIMCVLAFF